jgi:hypothetical protein
MPNLPKVTGSWENDILAGMDQGLLTRIFHTSKRRVRARGLRELPDVFVGRVPPRGALFWRFHWSVKYAG